MHHRDMADTNSRALLQICGSAFCCVLGQDTSSPLVRPGYCKCAKNTQSGAPDKEITRARQKILQLVWNQSAFITGAA